MRYLLASISTAGLVLVCPGGLRAQHYHRHYHGHTHYAYRPYHFHDSAGHMIDGYGHHVNSYGGHTGAVGLYEGNVLGNSLPYAANYPGAAVPTPGFGLPIRISHTEAADIPISYSLNGYAYVIRPGETQTIPNDRPWTIRFDRGGEFGLARYSLSPGEYEFAISEQGWQLYVQAVRSEAVPPSAVDGLQRNSLPPAPASPIAPAASGIMNLPAPKR